MTSTQAAPALGGTGTVLVVWSLIIVTIGAALFAYSIVVTVRLGRSRKHRRRAPTSPLPRPMPPPPASRPLALPPGPTVGGMPVGGPGARPRALPAGRGRGPLALPAAGHRFPAPPMAPGVAPAHGAGPARGPGGAAALPSGPIVGTGYGPAPGLPAPGHYGSPPRELPAAPSGPGTPATYGPRPGYGAYGGERPASQPDIVDVPDISALQAPGAAPTAPPAIYGTPPGHTPPGQTPPTTSDAGSGVGPPAALIASMIDSAGDDAPPPADPPRRARRRARGDECARLRAECEQMLEAASVAAAEAAQAAQEAEAARADFVAAQRVADEARRAIEALRQEAADVAARMATLAQDDGSARSEAAQAETTHAAFAAYRRGDISSEQLREVFSRAGGWSPEHDRISRRSTELRSEEAEAIRIRDAAAAAEYAAGERAHYAAITARSRDEEARNAAADARGRCAAAEACEERLRH